jgi:Glu-tRNA(Gln) amidotransferase subunit E-like FAD-binding protein
MQRILSLLIIATNLLILYDLHQLRNLIHDGSNTGTFLNTFLMGVLIVVTLIKKPFEVVDLRVTKNVDLK